MFMACRYRGYRRKKADLRPLCFARELPRISGMPIVIMPFLSAAVRSRANRRTSFAPIIPALCSTAFSYLIMLWRPCNTGASSLPSPISACVRRSSGRTGLLLRTPTSFSPKAQRRQQRPSAWIPVFSGNLRSIPGIPGIRASFVTAGREAQ
jgi:hypothetical protein